MLTKQRIKLLIKIMMIFICQSSFSGIPVWTFTPLTTTHVIVSPLDTAIIQYRVTNHSHETHTLALKPIEGITQITSAGNCPHYFTLEYKQSCTLTLMVNGSAIHATKIYGGPVVCNDKSPLQCYQPGASDVLDITRIDAPTVANITLSGSPLTLVAGSGTPGFIQVTNQSPALTVTNISANLSGTALDGLVTEDASNCLSLAPMQTCTLVFTSLLTSVPITNVPIQGNNSNTVTGQIRINNPTTAPLSVTGSPLTLTADSGVSGDLTITNNSLILTATNIAANLSGTALDGVVIQDASNCITLLPGQSCTLRFTPTLTAVTLTSFPIQGDNTTQISGQIEVVLPTIANITVSGSPLVLQGTNGVPVSGNLVITNQSNLLTATNISADISGPLAAAGVTQDASNCNSVPPQGTCNLVFTPAAQAVVATTVNVQGSNTSLTTASIAVNAPPQAPISITAGSPLLLYVVGATGNMTITNNSATEPAINITSNFTTTALNGNVTETGNTCANVAPGASCTLTFTPGSNVVSETNFPIQGSNTSVATGAIKIGITIGSPYEGGIVACLSGAPTHNLIMATADNSAAAPWSLIISYLIVNNSNNGALNTDVIVAAYPAGAYGASICHTYSNAGYSDWFLPARNQLYCLSSNRVALGGFPNANYWSSTEEFLSGLQANTVNIQAGTFTYGIFAKGSNQRIRCVRSFTPPP